MSDQNQESGEQRRREILTQARKTLERVKDIAERRDEPLPSPPDRVAEWRTRAEQHAAKCAQAKAELQLPSILEQLELRLTEERALILDVIGEALAAQRDFV